MNDIAKKSRRALACTALILLFTGLAGCSGVDVQTYKNNLPRLVLPQFFNGELHAHGIVKNRQGKVIRYFNAKILAHWDDAGIGHLDEYFEFDDGEKQRRQWQLQPDSMGGFIATANDTVGEGVGEVSGNALFLNYVLTVPYKDNAINVKVDDRMYMVNKNTLINESVLTKFGVKVGYVTLVIVKS